MSKNLPVPKGTQAVSKLTPLQLYLQEISRYALLSPEEEFEHAKRHFEDRDIAAAHKLVTSNLRLVVKIANDFRQAQASLLDLIQEGNYGLMQAVKKFNPYKGVKLSSYAAWWIRAYILKFIMDNKSQVKIGTTAAQRKLFFNLRREVDKLLAEYDHVDTKLLAAKLEVREKDVIEMQMRLNGPDYSLDAPLGSDEDGEGSTRGSMLASTDIATDDMLANSEIRQLFGEQLTAFRSRLRGRDLEIFEDRIMSEAPVTLQEIGDRYKISRERARQIESRIISNLKSFVKDSGIIDLETDK